MILSQRIHLKSATAILLVLALITIPAGIGFAFIFSGRAAPSRPEWVKVATIEQLPKDGEPRRFPIVLRRTDAWMRLSDETIGHVFLRRISDSDTILCLRSTFGPGCPVEFDSSSANLIVPCWQLTFDINGKSMDSSIADTIGVMHTILRDGTVYVRVDDVLTTEI